MKLNALIIIFTLLATSHASCPSIQRNVDYPGNDLDAGGHLGRVQGHLTLEQCDAWCRRSSACVGYTFIKNVKIGDNCAPKSSWNEATRKTGKSCCDSRQVTSDCSARVGLVQSVELDETRNCLYVTFAGKGHLLDNPHGYQRYRIYDHANCGKPDRIDALGMTNINWHGERLCVSLLHWINEWDRKSELSIDVEYKNAGGQKIFSSERFCPSGGACCTDESYVLGNTGQSCTEVCSGLGKTCLRDLSSVTRDTFQGLLKAAGLGKCRDDAGCGRQGTWWAHDQPAFVATGMGDANEQCCLGHKNIPTTGVDCGGRWPTVKRVCKCADKKVGRRLMQHGL